MLKRSLLLIFFVFLASCSHRHASRHHQPAPGIVTQSWDVPAFNRVVIEGKFNVGLHTGYSSPQVILKGDSRDLSHIKPVVVNGRLRIMAGEQKQHAPISVEVHGRYLNLFAYRGEGQINGTKLRSSLMDIDIDNKGSTTLGGQISLRCLKLNGKGSVVIKDIRSQNMNVKVAGQTNVHLTGMANAADVKMEDDARLSFYWVKSKMLKVDGSGRSYLQLAGITEILNVVLHDKACFNGRYLRASRAFVKTFNNSTAKISTVKRQHTLATDASNIYFYNLPTMQSDFMAANGSVLDMRDLKSPFIQE